MFCGVTMRPGAFAPSAVAPHTMPRVARPACAPVCAAAGRRQAEPWSAPAAGRAAAALAAALLLQGAPASAELLNLPRDVQAKVEQAPRKVPSVEELAQGDAPTTPSREFTPPKSLNEQLGSAQATGKLSLPDPLKTMEAPGGANGVVQQLQEQVRSQLDKTKEAVAENLPGPGDLTPGALRDRMVGEALTPSSPAVQMQK